MNPDKVENSSTSGIKARVCWKGTEGQSVKGRWQNEASALGMVKMMKILLGKRMCWVEYQH